MLLLGSLYSEDLRVLLDQCRLAKEYDVGIHFVLLFIHCKGLYILKYYVTHKHPFEAIPLLKSLNENFPKEQIPYIFLSHIFDFPSRFVELIGSVYPIECLKYFMEGTLLCLG